MKSRSPAQNYAFFGVNAEANSCHHALMQAHDQKPLVIGTLVSLLGMLTIFSTVVLEHANLGALYIPTIVAGLVIWALGQAKIHSGIRQRSQQGH
jgi:hypothetical protein